MGVNEIKIDQKRFYRDFIIRYYPNQDDTHTNQLIGLPKLKEIINRKGTFDSLMERVEAIKNDKLVVKLRRGSKIEFVMR